MPPNRSKHFSPPRDLVIYLESGKQLVYDPGTCEPGLVRLKPVGNLSLDEIWLHPESKEDPNFGADGYYNIPAVSLTGECENYDPEFILLWLPNEKLYGTWDCDHWQLTTFPKAKWADIALNPAPYLDAQWNPNSVKRGGIKPWKTYKFRKGMPF